MLTAHGGGAKAVEAGEACFSAELRSRSFPRSNEKNSAATAAVAAAVDARGSGPDEPLMSPYRPHNVARAFGTHWGLDLPDGLDGTSNQSGKSLLYLCWPLLWYVWYVVS